VTAKGRVLIVAGSDSGGGAGIQADIKAFTRCGVYGTSAITVVTAQNTLGVLAAHEVPAGVVRAQIEAVVADIGVDAVKVGMLGSLATVLAVASALTDLLAPAVPIVVDPVLRASTGKALLEEEALDSLIGELLPLAAVITPNLGEARALLGRTGGDAGSTDTDLARALLALGPASVVLTAGHRATPGDIYCDATQIVEITGTHHESRSTHGSGCTHSAVLAAELAKGRTPLEAAEIAASVTAEAILHGLDTIGAGEGPVDVSGLTGR
jgi:hydroxymethylpyrimidine/phosphomethylpyrimidine kinase